MRVRAVALVMMIVSCATCFAQASDVQQFVDRIKAANPVDRWMPSGTISFTKTEAGTLDSGDQYSYTMVGSLSFNEDCALWERTVTEGEMPIKPGSLHTPKGDTESPPLFIPKDSVVAISPGAYKSYTPSQRHVTVFTHMEFRVEGFSVLIDGVLPTAILSYAAQGNSAVFGRTLVVNLSKEATYRITVDDLDRVLEIVQQFGDKRKVFTTSEHVQVGGKWVARRVGVVCQLGGQQRASDYVLSFTEWAPSDSQLELPVGEATVETFDRNMVSRLGAGDPANTASAIKLDQRLCSTCIKTDYPYPTIEVPCCGDIHNCASQDWRVYLAHGHCVFTGYPWQECYSNPQCVERTWDCSYQPEWPAPPWCQYPCYISSEMIEHWQDNVCDYW